MKLTAAMHKINAAINRQPPAAEARRWSVFVSYESTDAATAAELAGDLRAAGFASWWAGELGGGEHFRDAIIRALDAAHAAVVIWSPTSIRSLWVEAEATRAFEQRKLVPVRFPDLDLRAIPPPFGVLHTLPLEDRSGLMRALERVVAAEPRTSGSPLSPLASMRSMAPP